MFHTSSLLIPLDRLHEDNAVLQLALAFAPKLGVKTIHLLHVTPIGQLPFFHAETSYDPMIQSYQQEVLLTHKKQMTELVNALIQKGFNIESAVLPDLEVAEAIARYADEHQIGLIFMGTHARKGFDHFLLGSVAEHVVQKANCPVLTIHQQQNQLQKWIGTQRILFPFDFSKPAKQMWHLVTELAETMGASVDILHVVEEGGLAPVYLPFWEMKISNAEMSDYLKGEIEKFIQAQGSEKQVPYSIQMRRGVASKEIVAYIEAEAPDLVIMATHGLTGISHALIGSVTERVVRHAPCPVLTWKPLVDKPE